MQSNDRHTADVSETEPILGRHSNVSQRSEDPISSCEITTSEGESVVDIDDNNRNIDGNENCHLLNATDQLQCRICLEVEGC